MLTRRNTAADSDRDRIEYHLNDNGLDRYNREGITFLFDRTTKKFSYNGAAWREILRRYSNSPEAAEARKHLDALGAPRTK